MLKGVRTQQGKSSCNALEYWLYRLRLLESCCIHYYKADLFEELQDLGHREFRLADMEVEEHRQAGLERQQ